MINELMRAFFFIFAAEMGDKTQILAMTFATRYRVSEVLIGVFIGSALNHGIAIALGSYLANVIPLDIVQIVAGILFVGFGLWTLRVEENEEEEETKKEIGPILTVASTFFIGELGDKTQLTAMTLATDANYPIFILMGTALGMVVTSGLGIYIGTKVGKKIPELAIKIGSAFIFIFFGTLKLLNTVPDAYINLVNVSLYFIVLATIIAILLKQIIDTRKDGRVTALREVAATLYIQAHELKKAVENICLGEKYCGMCEGRECLIGFTKRILENATEKGEYTTTEGWERIPQYQGKDFNKTKVIEALSMIISHYLKYGYHDDENYVINKTRQALEVLTFGESIPFKGNIKDYFNMIKKKDRKTANIIIKRAKELNKE